MNQYLNELGLILDLSPEATAMAAVAEAVQNLNANLANLSNLNVLTGISSSLTTIDLNFSSVVKAFEEDRLEEIRTNRNGTWVTEWYVEAPPRTPYRFDIEDDAYEGAREMRKALGPEAEIRVFCMEVKRFNTAVVPNTNWEESEPPNPDPGGGATAGRE